MDTGLIVRSEEQYVNANTLTFKHTLTVKEVECKFCAN